jgi:Flp pilus assembly protein TadG
MSPARPLACFHARLCRIAVNAGRDRRGAVALEFAFVAPALFFSLVVLFQVGYNYFVLAGLDSAAHAGARAIMTGSAQQAGLTAQQFIQQIVCPSLAPAMSCSKVVVNVSVALSNPGELTNQVATLPAPAVRPTTYYTKYVHSNYSGLIFPSTSQSADKFCPGGAGDIVVVQVLYPAPLFTRLLNPSGASSAWQMSTSTFVNEPFTNGATYAGC